MIQLPAPSSAGAPRTTIEEPDGIGYPKMAEAKPPFVCQLNTLIDPVTHSCQQSRVHSIRPAKYQALRHSDASIISSFIRALLSVRRSLAELKTRSHSALIAGIDSTSKAIRASDG